MFEKVVNMKFGSKVTLYRKGEKVMSKANFIKSSGNPFKDMGFNEIEVKNLKLRK